MDEIVNSYISLAYGYQIDSNKKTKIKNIVGYLHDNNFNEKFIISYLLKNELILKDELWNNSLLKPNTFYYHNKLRITSDSPIWNVHSKEKSNKFYLEMIINYTMEDLLDYFYTSFNIPVNLRDFKRDVGAFNHLLNKKYIDKVESVDFILALIDYNKIEAKKNENIFITNPLELKFFMEVYNKFQYIIDNSKHNKIVWRNYND